MIVLTVCSLGATFVSILLKSETGYREITVLDEDWFNDKQSYMGRTCGRLAGRVAPYIVPGRSETDLFEFSSKDFPLHGGKIGFSHRVWKCTSTFLNLIRNKKVDVHRKRGFNKRKTSNEGINERGEADAKLIHILFFCGLWSDEW